MPSIQKWFLVAVLGLVLVPTAAYGGILFSQLEQSATSTVPNATAGGMRYDGTLPAGVHYVILRAYDVPTTTLYVQYDCGGSTTNGKATNLGNGYFQRSFDHDICTGGYFGFGLIASPLTAPLHLYGTQTSGSSTARYATSSPGLVWKTDTTIKQAFFIISTEAGLPNIVGITSPTNGSSGADFSHWGLFYNFVSTSTTNYERISYGTSTDALNYWDYWFSAEYDLSGNVEPIKSQQLENGVWYARANLFQNGEIIATSSLISFTVNAPYIPESYFPMPTSTATSSEWVITCDSVSGFFANSICSVLQYLFSPKLSDLDRFKTVWTSIESKPPIGYFTKIKAVINSISTGTTSTVQFADLSSIQGNFFTPLKAVLAVLLWILAAFWMFSRFRHFQL